jgi:predicted RNA binding protein YcfA (HicA-like mRNA interferase family)
MTKLPSVSGDQVIKALGKAGFIVHHQKGSHVTMKHSEKPALRVVVPCHKGKDLGKGLLFSIIKDSGLAVEEFLALL